MIASALSVHSLPVAVFLLMAGGGVMTTLVRLRLEAAGHGAAVIGLVATAYFVGLTLGSLRVGGVMRQVGHIRTFAAVASLLSASTLAYALHQHPALCILLRLIDGLCVASVFVCLESWLNDRAEPTQRGSVLAAYMIALYAGQAMGQFLLTLDSAPIMPFVAASIIISLAVLPVALTRMSGPTKTEQEPLATRGLYAASPLGLVGVGVTGLIIGAFYALGPVFARGLGMNLSNTAMFMSVAITGGVALQWPLGWLSDHLDSHRIIIGVLACLTATGAALATTSRPGASLMLLSGLFGGLAFALYPLCVAHTNDHLMPRERVSASGGLVLVYSLGAAVGPLSGSLAILALGPAGLFAWAAGCAASALMFGLWRQRQRDPVPLAEQQPHQLLPRTTPMAARLDPLAQEEQTRAAAEDQSHALAALSNLPPMAGVRMIYAPASSRRMDNAGSSCTAIDFGLRERRSCLLRGSTERLSDPARSLMLRWNPEFLTPFDPSFIFS